ncbi:MAG: DUF1048 domain-containing protein [Lachnospiraceae bacterium]|jgi:DNA-binding ferritin-like protein (Dps family)|nr:DUF1048 domain-containing protein [Lachnospiraceae bacterium]
MKEYFTRMMEEKKEYKQMIARVKSLPEDYRFVYDKMQHYMWGFAAGDGYDMVKIHYDLVDLFEAGAAEGKHVLDVTGSDVAAFCDELLRNARTYTEDWHDRLNRDIQKKFGEKKDQCK